MSHGVYAPLMSVACAGRTWYSRNRVNGLGYSNGTGRVAVETHRLQLSHHVIAIDANAPAAKAAWRNCTTPT